MSVISSLAACSKPAPTPAGTTYTFHMRGQIAAIAASPAVDGQLYIHHEPVPDFRNTAGELSPMNSMTMPFQIDPKIPLTSFHPGDKVAFTYTVNWDTNTHVVTTLTLLPPETPLTFTTPSTTSAPPPTP